MPPLDKEQQDAAIDAVSCLTPRKIIADRVGLTPKSLKLALKADPAFEFIFKATEAQAKIDHIRNSFEMAKVHKSMAIFLLKSRCGFREVDEEVADTDEKAQAIREGLDKMLGPLAVYTGANGEFVKPKDAK